ncbi:MAG: hypothetical protein HQK59_12315 [Deltaproteobacteria bacterium]|nr:hypothetical protein [Deltaproteobacteria bacterium]
MDIEKEGREQDNQDIKKKEKERFNQWLGQKLGPDGRRVTLLLTGEDARLWDSLKQESESNNDLIRRLLRTAANDPGGDVQFELKHMVAEVLAGVAEIKAGVNDLQSVVGKLDVSIDARQQTGFDANVGATIDTPLDVKLDAERDDDTKSLAVADGRNFDGKFDARTGEPEAEAQEPPEPIAQETEAETPATDDDTQNAAEPDEHIQDDTQEPTPPVAGIDEAQTLAEIKARLTWSPLIWPLR